METAVIPKTITWDGRIAILCKAYKTCRCDLPGCTGVILPGQEFYLVLPCPHNPNRLIMRERIHISDIKRYYSWDNGRGDICYCLFKLFDCFGTSYLIGSWGCSEADAWRSAMKEAIKEYRIDSIDRYELVLMK